MLPGLELLHCDGLAVPLEVMRHVVRVESSNNQFAIGVVGGRLARQPQTLAEALATARTLEAKGYNFSVGLAQVNRHNLAPQGLGAYEKAFEVCPNVRAGSRILADCHARARGDWGKAFSCYYSGNFSTGFRHGYVQKIFASMRGTAPSTGEAIAVLDVTKRREMRMPSMASNLVVRRQTKPDESVGTFDAGMVAAPQESLVRREPVKVQATTRSPQPETSHQKDGAFVF